jgi:hypothetical protein
MKFEVLKAVTAKFTVFWNVIPCSLVDTYQFLNPEEGRMFLRNFSRYLLHYMASHPTGYSNFHSQLEPIVFLFLAEKGKK